MPLLVVSGMSRSINRSIARNFTSSPRRVHHLSVHSHLSFTNIHRTRVGSSCLPCQANLRNVPHEQKETATRSFTSSAIHFLKHSKTSAASCEPSTSRPESQSEPGKEVELHESPYTIPNALTVARICACPFLGYAIVSGQFRLATGILVAGGLSDWLDGFLARRWNQKSVLGSILDPAADKALMTTLVVTLAYKGLLPLPLAMIIFGRDLALSLWAFYLRFTSLPPPRTLGRYFDPSMPSAEVRPTQISKINTALQLLLMGVTTISPLLSFPMGTALHVLQWTVAGTTVWSGFSYLGASGFRILKNRPDKP